jgi:hypothetical protein
MRRYTITDEEKRGTLLVAGWREIEGRWFQKFEGPEMYEGRTLDSAFRTWQDRVR